MNIDLAAEIADSCLEIKQRRKLLVESSALQTFVQLHLVLFILIRVLCSLIFVESAILHRLLIIGSYVP